MPKKRIIFFSLLLIFSIGFYIVIEKKFTYNFVNRFINITQNLYPERIDEIVLAKKKGKDWQKWILKKTDHKWEIIYKYPRPANVKKIRNILAAFRNIKGEIRAKSEKTWSVFNLRDDQALHLFIKNKNKLIAHFLIGKKGPSFDTCFIRLPDSPEVYLVNKNILTLFKIFSKEPKFPDPKQFLELFTDWKVINPPIKLISELNFSYYTYKWNLKINSNSALFNGKNISLKKVNLFLKKFFPLMSVEILDPEKFKNKKFEGIFNIKLKKGPQFTLKITQTEKGLCVKRGPYYYLLTPESQQRLLNPVRIFSSIQSPSENDNSHQVDNHKASDK